MKCIEVKKGNKTTFRYVPDNYEPEDYDLEHKDLTTSDRKSIGYSDISKERWESIFGDKNGKRAKSETL